MSKGTVVQIKQSRPDENETGYFWKLFHAAQRNDYRWTGSSLAWIADELSYCPNLERKEKLFLLRAWQVLVDDKGGFGRFMGAFDTYVFNMQDPDEDTCAWKPELAQLLQDGGLLPVLLEAYQEARYRIDELEARAVVIPDDLDFDCEFENGDYDIDEEPWLRGRVDGFNAGMKLITKAIRAAGITVKGDGE